MGPSLRGLSPGSPSYPAAGATATRVADAPAFQHAARNLVGSPTSTPEATTMATRKRTVPQLTRARTPAATPSTGAPATDAEARTRELERRNAKLNRILEVAKALGSIRDLDQLLNRVLTEAKEVVEADRLSLFIADRERGELWTKIAQGLGSQEIRIPMGVGIAGVVAQTRQPLLIPDAYADPRFNRAVDLRTGYRTRNILTVPMLNTQNEITGVIQALNKTEERDFTAEDQELLMALGGQAAVSVENALLQQDIERLFEGFIRASVYAIEARDPTTSGHSERVAVLTVGIAEQLDHVDKGPYAAVRLGTQQVKELRYAALLHDFGKVGVREHVLVKSNKLYPQEYELLRQRFALVRRAQETEHWKRKAQLLMSDEIDAARAQIAALDEQLVRELGELDGFLEFIAACNRPTVLEQGGFERLSEIARRTWADLGGEVKPLLLPEEVKNLSIPRGSLNHDERREIESHVTHTFRFLCNIPWTRELRRVPEIAYAHHEKLDGKGYPRQLTNEQIPVQSKMMTIADIYDALTASDRPYKRAVPHQKALDILKDEEKRGQVDGSLLDLFIATEVHKRLANPPV
ncbi:MAG: GAF domain-containing protein [Deltaproteobacteria bacterium]|nr:GAF domain-containing protein [Deltaproteobacteria bacterium]